MPVRFRRSTRRSSGFAAVTAPSTVTVIDISWTDSVVENRTTAESVLAAMNSIYPRNYLSASAVPNTRELNFLKHPPPPASKATIRRRAVDMSTLTVIVAAS